MDPRQLGNMYPAAANFIPDYTGGRTAGGSVRPQGTGSHAQRPSMTYEQTDRMQPSSYNAPSVLDSSTFSPPFDLGTVIRRPDPEVPDFISKLWQVLMDPVYRGVLDWDRDGTSIVFSDSPQCRDLIIKLFRRQTKPGDPGTSHMSSFIRNLNNYGFSKVTNRLGPDRGNAPYQTGGRNAAYETLVFKNDNFQRGQPGKLSLIKSKKKLLQAETTPAPPPAVSTSNPTTPSNDEVAALREEVTHAMQQLEERLTQQMGQLTIALSLHDQNSRAQYHGISSTLGNFFMQTQPTPTPSMPSLGPSGIFSPPRGAPPSGGGR